MADPPTDTGPGQPGDAFQAFADAAVKWTAAAKPDPQVSAAVALGWHVGEALTWATREPPRVSGLDKEDLWDVLCGRIVRTQRALAKDAAPFPTGAPETAKL